MCRYIKSNYEHRNIMASTDFIDDNVYDFNCHGHTYQVNILYTSYASNDTLAVILVDAEDNYDVIADVTVNISHGFAEGNLQYVDTNNCSEIKKFLVENGIAEPMGVSIDSGYCSYPLYRFLNNLIR